MKNSVLIAKRTIINSSNSIIKFLALIALIIVLSALFTGILILEPKVFPNQITLNVAMIIRSILISIYLIYIERKIIVDLKKGYFKNLMVNSFSKQEYFFGTVLGYYFFLFLTLLGNLAITYGAMADFGFPEADFTTYFLFTLFYFFLAPSLVFLALTFLLYYFFTQGKISFWFNLFVLALIIFSLIWLSITAYYQFSLKDNFLHWQNYLYLVFPYYNLIYAIPQAKSLVGVVYWWVYLIDFAYSLVLGIIWFILQQKIKPTFIINGKPSKKYF